MDIYCALPLLSTYLGHASVAATGQYVRLTQDMFPEIIEEANAIAAFVIPGGERNEKSSGFPLLREQVPCPISSRGGRRQPKHSPVIQGHFFAVHKILQVARKYASGEDDARTADKGTSMRVSPGSKMNVIAASQQGTSVLRRFTPFVASCRRKM
jgi:hypothetical protein